MMAGKRVGQSLIEVLVAVSVFVTIVAAVGYLVIDAHIASRQGAERTRATFLASEGLEAARSIRDADFSGLASGSHGISLSGNRWIFSGTSDTQDQFTRVVTVTDASAGIKKVTSRVYWQFTPSRANEVVLTTCLGNWASGP